MELSRPGRLHDPRPGRAGARRGPDFRTWGGTLHAFVHLAGVDTDGEIDPESFCREALDVVAERLQNTRAVCRDFYVHPGVLEAFRDGDLPVRVYRRTSSDGAGLSPPEAALLEVLERITRR